MNFFKKKEKKNEEKLLDKILDLVKLIQTKVANLDAEMDAMRMRFKKKVPVSSDGDDERLEDKIENNINDGFDGIRALRKELNMNG